MVRRKSYEITILCIGRNIFSSLAGMAGDGGNDCGGLRAAHAGLALSDAEARVGYKATNRIFHGPPKTHTFRGFMENNLVVRWPKPVL